MNNNKQKVLTNILVICLYFLWPYTLSGITNLFDLSEIVSLYISLSINFVFLFIVIYIYRKELSKSLRNLKNKFKINILNSTKIFFLGVLGCILFNTFLTDILKIDVLNNFNSMVSIFKKIPVIFILNTLFYYPVIEELIFKLSFKEIFKNKWFFIIITGLFNALFQVAFSLNSVTDLLYIISYSILLSSLSYIYYKTDNIIYPIFLRMCYNLIPCIIYMIDLLQ